MRWAQQPIDPDAAALRIREPAERLRAASKEHDRLLAQIGRRRKTREQLEQDIRAAMNEIAGEVMPLIEECRRVDEQIHAMLDGLADDGRRPRHERGEIRFVHEDLQAAGLLSRRGTSERPPVAVDDELVQPSAVRPQDGERSLLRRLFRRLAEALHPDKVQDEQAKAQRTEVMKQITVAYHDADFARLVEIERTWARSGAPMATDHEDETEQRFSALVRANEELRKQLRALDRELRGMRRSAHGRLARDLQRSRAAGLELDVTGDLAHELAMLRRLHGFVARFRDGQMSLAQFLRGPGADDDDELDVTDALADLVILLQEQDRGTRTSAKRRRRRS